MGLVLLERPPAHKGIRYRIEIACLGELGKAILLCMPFPKVMRARDYRIPGGSRFFDPFALFYSSFIKGYSKLVAGTKVSLMVLGETQRRRLV